MPGKSKKGGGLESSPIYKKQAYGTAKSPFTMKGSAYKKVLPTVTVSAKKDKVVTTMNKDGSITKTKGKKTSTYTPSKTETGKGKKYTNPEGRSFYTS